MTYTLIKNIRKKVIVVKTKLTLRIEKDLVENIRKLSKRKGESVSKIVENYFKLTLKNKEKKEELTPTVKKLKGILKNKKVSEKDYKKHLEEKYLWEF